MFSIPPSVWLFPGFPCGSDGEESTLQCGRPRFNPWVGKIPWRRAWQCTPVFLPGEPHGQRSLVATVHGVTKSQTRLKLLSMHAWLFPYHLDCTKIPGLWSDKKLTGRWGGPAQALAVFSLEAGWSPCGTPCPELAWVPAPQRTRRSSPGGRCQGADCAGRCGPGARDWSGLGVLKPEPLQPEGRNLCL